VNYIAIASSSKVTLMSSSCGLSLSATRDIALGEVVLPLFGEPIAKPSRYSIQIGENLHLEGPPESPTNYINHSCNPSCYINWSSMSFVSLSQISAGEAITYHYSTSEWDMKEKFRCRCGSESCLGTINGAKYLKPKDLETISPYLSPFLLSKISIASMTPDNPRPFSVEHRHQPSTYTPTGDGNGD